MKGRARTKDGKPCEDSRSLCHFDTSPVPEVSRTFSETLACNVSFSQCVVFTGGLEDVVKCFGLRATSGIQNPGSERRNCGQLEERGALRGEETDLTNLNPIKKLIGLLG